MPNNYDNSYDNYGSENYNEEYESYEDSGYTPRGRGRGRGRGAGRSGPRGRGGRGGRGDQRGGPPRGGAGFGQQRQSGGGGPVRSDHRDFRHSRGGGGVRRAPYNSGRGESENNIKFWTNKLTIDRCRTTINYPSVVGAHRWPSGDQLATRTKYIADAQARKLIDILASGLSRAANGGSENPVESSKEALEAMSRKVASLSGVI